MHIDVYLVCSFFWFCAFCLHAFYVGDAEFVAKGKPDNDDHHHQLNYFIITVAQKICLLQIKMVWRPLTQIMQRCRNVYNLLTYINSAYFCQAFRDFTLLCRQKTYKNLWNKMYHDTASHSSIVNRFNFIMNHSNINANSTNRSTHLTYGIRSTKYWIINL